MANRICERLLTQSESTEGLQITTLDNAIYIHMKNDVSFVFQSRLQLYEHQSTINPNLPLRNLFYVTDVLHTITRDFNLYTTRTQKIPTPGFVVFYNGIKEQPDRTVLRLSDLFEVPTDRPELELTVTQLNINAGHNRELLSRCRILNEYALFNDKVQRYLRESGDIQKAVPKAIDDCIEEGVLTDFLSREKAEVRAMTIYEFNEEQFIRDLREEGREEERLNTERERKRAEKAEARIKQLEEELKALKGS